MYKKLNWKGFFVAILVVVLLEILAFKFLKTDDLHIHPPTGEQTENWQVYRNDQMGFSLKLPPQWFSHNTSIQGSKTETVFSYPVDSNNPTLWVANQEAGITIIRYPNDGKDIQAEAQQWVDQVEKTTPHTFNKQLETTTLAGKNAVVLQSADNHQEYIYVANGNYTYNITLSTARADTHSNPPIADVPFPKYQEMFEEILSTFVFSK
ncbi:MAG: PsbP-related protein [Candidatus Levyibacteriota bacterium]